MSEHYLASERLQFFGPRLNDIDIFERIQMDAQLMKYMGQGQCSLEKAKLLLMGCAYHQDCFGFSLGPVALKDTGELIGQAGIFHYNLLESDPRIEIAFAFFPAFWGKGLATEAVRALQGWARTEHDIHKLFAVVNPKNLASRKVLSKCGFVYKKMTSREKVKAELWAMKPKA